MDKCLSEKIVYESKRFNVQEAVYLDDNGKEHVRNHVLTKSAVAILPITKDGKIVFVKEARTAIGNIISYDLPAGIIEDNEEPEIAAVRELEEETGYVSKTLTFLCSYFASKGYTNEKIYLYMADNLDKKVCQRLDVGEKIETEEIEYDQAIKMLDNKELNSAPLNISLQMYKNMKKGCNESKDTSSDVYAAFDMIRNNLSEDTIRVINKNEKAAVFNVDMINDFTRTSLMQNPLAVNIIPSIERMLKQCEKSGNKIYHICEAHTKDSLELNNFPQHGIIGTKGAELVDELSDIKYEEIFYKNSTNGFHNLQLRELATNMKDVDIVVFSGVLTDMCVLQAAISLKTFFNDINRDVDVVIATECVETYNAPDHNRDLFHYMALEFARQAGIKIVKNIEFEI